jgi:hypothetical protein
LPGPVLDSKCRTSIASRETESSNATANIIGEEFQIKQQTLATGPAAQNLIPTTLLLVAVGKGDVNMLQREIILRKLLQAQDDGILGGVLNPRALSDKRSSDLYPIYFVRIVAIVKGRGIERRRANLGEFLI